LEKQDDGCMDGWDAMGMKELVFFKRNLTVMTLSHYLRFNNK